MSNLETDPRSGETRAETQGGGPVVGQAAPPPRFGRYTLIRRLGEGGMGTVWSAYDDTLDRRVAIKVVSGVHRSERSRDRMLREAKALARVNHPNVVQVFEVGELEQGLFVAMEYVVGDSLRQWLTGERQFHEVLAMFLQAARGLAAVHEAKLVHRDFKPDNVMIGDDGRVRLVDFGIAKQEAGPELEAVALPEDARAEISIDRITRTGEFIGTPMYMSPEQLRGLSVDARSDQFGFCVSLFRAAYHTLPFPGEKLGALAQNVFLGNTVDPPRPPGVPAGLRAILLRGLAVDPDARWPSMDALIQALERSLPRPGRQRRIAMGVATVAVLGGVAWASRAREPGCDGGPEQLAPLWNPARADALRSAFADADAETTFDHVEGALGRFVQTWLGQHRDACMAHRRGEQSAPLLDRRMACLERRRRELGALLAEFDQFDVGLVRAAPDAVSRLASPEQCGDLERLAEDGGPAPRPEDAARIDAARAELERARAQERAGRAPRARETLEAVRAEVLAIDHPPLLFDFYLLLADLDRFDGRLAQSQAALETAFKLAVVHGLEHGASDVSVGMVALVGAEQGRFADVDAWVRVADAWLERIGDPPLSRVTLLEAQAAIDERANRLEQARTRLEEALAMLAGEDHHEALRSLAISHNELGLVLHRLHQWREAEAALRQSREEWIELLGPDHPITTDAFNNLGSLFLDENRPDAAEAAFREALVARERIFGRDHPKVAHVLHNLGTTAAKRGDSRTALEFHTEALAILERNLGPDDPAVAVPLMAIGNCHTALGQPRAALPFLARALAIDETTLGPEHPEVAYDLHATASARNAMGEYEAARHDAARSLAIREGLGLDPRYLGESRIQLAVALRGLGRLDEARTQGERALGEYTANPEAAEKIRAWLGTLGQPGSAATL